MSFGRMKERGVGRAAAVFLLLTAPAVAGGSPAELISDFRLMHGEVAVVRDETLDRIALEQARAVAAKNELSHETLGPFTSRIAPAGGACRRRRLAFIAEGGRAAQVSHTSLGRRPPDGVRPRWSVRAVSFAEACRRDGRRISLSGVPTLLQARI